MQCNTSGMQYNWNAMQAMHDAVEHNMMQCDTAQHNGVQQMQAMLQSTMQCYRAQHNCNTTSSDCNSESSNYGGTCNRCLKGKQSSNARGDGNHLMGRPARKLAKDEQKLEKIKQSTGGKQFRQQQQHNKTHPGRMQCNATGVQCRCKRMQWSTMNHSGAQCNARQWSTHNTRQWSTSQCKAVEHNMTQCHGVWHDGTQQFGMQCNATQYSEDVNNQKLQKRQQSPNSSNSNASNSNSTTTKSINICEATVKQQ